MSEQTVSAGIPRFDVRDRLRKARECVGLDQRELADEIDVSRNTVVNYENGATQRLKPLVLKQWALRTGVPYEWLTTGEETLHAPDGGGSGLPRVDSNHQPSGSPSPQVTATIPTPRRLRLAA
jgi:transcriptional regulator with XRE-family HTH domain